MTISIIPRIFTILTLTGNQKLHLIFIIQLTLLSVVLLKMAYFEILEHRLQTGTIVFEMCT